MKSLRVAMLCVCKSRRERRNIFIFVLAGSSLILFFRFFLFIYLNKKIIEENNWKIQLFKFYRCLK